MDPTQPALPMSSNEFDPRQHRAVTVRAAAARKVSARATRARVVRAGAVRRLVSRLADTGRSRQWGARLRTPSDDEDAKKEEEDVAIKESDETSFSV
jgi:hypothetical protein